MAFSALQSTGPNIGGGSPAAHRYQGIADTMVQSPTPHRHIT
jgi:hypothetical protein